MKPEPLLIPLILKDVDPSESMVGAAVYVHEGEPTHAALIIRYNGETKIFHFLGSVELEIAEDSSKDGLYTFIKELNFIPSSLVPSFLAHCELIQQEAKPKYGFFYDSRSLYGEDGKFRNVGFFPEYMTCVGFCLTVIQSYLITEEFLHYPDWDSTTLDRDLDRTNFQMFEIQQKYPELKPEDLKAAVRRILPIEYFSGAYSDARPVRKAFTDEFSKKLKREFALLVA